MTRIRRTVGTKQSTITTLLQAVFSTTLGVLPAYLLGALAVQIRTDLHIGPAEIGIGAALLFGVTGVLSRPLGLLVQKQGTTWGIIVAGVLAAVSLLGVGLAPSLPLLYTALVLGGVGNALAQPAANLGVSSVVGSHRLGLALAIKQTAIPAATLLAGLAVPGIAVTLGWRWVLLIAAAASLALILWASLARMENRGPSVSDRSETDRGTPRGGLIAITVGAGLAAAAATSLGVFMVDSAVESGMTPTSAGLLFAASALLGLVVRIVLGAAMDRHPGRSPYVLVANLLLGGAAGFLLLALGEGIWFMAGSLIAYGAGWTWPGLVHFSVVRDNRQAAASATGVLQTGVSLGGAAGPLAFGFLTEATSYDSAWMVAATVAAAAAITFHIGRRMILHSRRTSARPPHAMKNHEKH
jgi:MFS family permease